MKNFVMESNSLPLVAPEGGVISGTGYLFGAIFAVAAITAAEGEPFEGWTEGVYDLDAATHANNQAIAQGGTVYFDAAAGKCTATAAGNTAVGVATEDKVSTVAMVRVRLVPRLVATGDAIADINLAAVTGVDGVGNNAASKADVDARMTTINNKVNAIIAALEAAGIVAA